MSKESAKILNRTQVEMRKTSLVMLQVILAVFLTEAAARIFFSDFAHDNIYLEKAFSRLLNSRTIFANRRHAKIKFGFAFSPNAEKTEHTKEFTYTVKTNSLGFRAKEIQPRDADEYRVMLLGDSMFWGVGVEESDMISSLMEKLAKDSSGLNLSVYNFAISGYNTVQELIVAKTYLSSVKADQIILGFCIANDIIPNAIAFIDDHGNYSTSSEMELKIKRELQEGMGLFFHSVAWRITSLNIYVPKARYQIAMRDEVISRSYALLAELNRLAAENHLRFAVVIFYPKDSVQGGIPEAWSHSRRAGHLIHSFCLKNSIETLDLLEYMNTPEHKKKYFFQEDGHLNKEGNHVVAGAIFNDLIKPHTFPKRKRS